MKTTPTKYVKPPWLKSSYTTQCFFGYPLFDFFQLSVTRKVLYILSENLLQIGCPMLDSISNIRNIYIYYHQIGNRCAHRFNNKITQVLKKSMDYHGFSYQVLHIFYL